MTNKDVTKIVKYWHEASIHDLETASSLFKTGRYDYCLFLCHLSIEKLLKAIVAKKMKDHPPYTHNLLYLAGKAEFDLSKAQIALLDEINQFNIEARYPEDLKAFYEKADRFFAKKYLGAAKEMWKWLQKKLEEL